MAYDGDGAIWDPHEIGIYLTHLNLILDAKCGRPCWEHQSWDCMVSQLLTLILIIFSHLLSIKQILLPKIDLKENN